MAAAAVAAAAQLTAQIQALRCDVTAVTAERDATAAALAAKEADLLRLHAFSGARIQALRCELAAVRAERGATVASMSAASEALETKLRKEIAALGAECRAKAADIAKLRSSMDAVAGALSTYG